MISLEAVKEIREVLPGAIPVQDQFINLVPPRDQLESLFASRSLGIDSPL